MSLSCSLSAQRSRCGPRRIVFWQDRHSKSAEQRPGLSGCSASHPFFRVFCGSGLLLRSCLDRDRFLCWSCHSSFSRCPGQLSSLTKLFCMWGFPAARPYLAWPRQSRRSLFSETFGRCVRKQHASVFTRCSRLFRLGSKRRSFRHQAVLADN